MKFSPITKVIKDYFNDAGDTDQFFWQPLMSSVPSLRPTEDSPRDLQAFLNNRSPLTGMKLRRRDTPVTGMGFALTLPKCISVLELLAIDPRLAGAVSKAAQVCLDLVPLIAAPAGIVKDGKTASTVVAFAACQRLTKAQPSAPHRHVHLGVLSLAMNAGLQRVTGADLGLVAHAGELLSALFQHAVAWEAAKLGYRIETEGDSFTVVGFDRDLVAEFSSGPRPKTARDFPLRPANGAPAQLERWRGQLNQAQLIELPQLGQFKPNLEPDLPFAGHLISTARAALLSDFFLPVDAIAAQTLRATFGQMPADLALLARCLTGELPAGLEARKFQLGGRCCWGTPAGLAAERGLFELVRGLPLAPSGWIAGVPAHSWWAKVLTKDCHRVAVLRGDLDKSELAALRAVMESQHGRPRLMMIRKVERRPLRQDAPVIMAHLQSGGSLLFVTGIKKGRQSLWLDQLPLDTGVPVLQAGQREVLEVKGEARPRFTFAPGMAVEVFAQTFSHQMSAFLLTTQARRAATNLEVRRLRQLASPKSKGKIVKRLAWVPSSEPLRPGRGVQFSSNTGGIMATETMTVAVTTDAGIQVQRPGGLSAFIPQEQVGRLLVFKPQATELQGGDRIRLTRNNGSKPIQSGLRSGFQFVVGSVEPDGTAHLNRQRTLPAEAGHWEYAFCAAIEGPPLSTGRLICDATDLPLIVSAGWLQSGVHVVVCAASKSEALAALTEAIQPVSEKLLPDTDELCIEAAIRVELADAEARRIREMAKPAPVPLASVPPAPAVTTMPQIESPTGNEATHEITI